MEKELVGIPELPGVAAPSAAIPEQALPMMMDALKSASSWLERWAKHVGNCRGDAYCTCGLVAIRSEVEIALQAAEGDLF